MTRLSAALLHDTGCARLIELPLVRCTAATSLRGEAFVVSTPAGDNLAIHRALADAPADAVLVVATGAMNFGYFGALMTLAAKTRALGGLVIDGCVRDRDELAAESFPIFARGFCPRGTSKHGAEPVHEIVLGGVTVRNGDLVVGDGDGVVIVPRARVDEALQLARAREQFEEGVRKDITRGRTTLEIFTR